MIMWIWLHFSILFNELVKKLTFGSHGLGSGSKRKRTLNRHYKLPSSIVPRILFSSLLLQPWSTALSPTNQNVIQCFSYWIIISVKAEIQIINARTYYMCTDTYRRNIYTGVSFIAGKIGCVRINTSSSSFLFFPVKVLAIRLEPTLSTRVAF